VAKINLQIVYFEEENHWKQSCHTLVNATQGRRLEARARVTIPLEIGEHFNRPTNEFSRLY